jgi:Flp pilus assembly protein TadD
MAAEQFAQAGNERAATFCFKSLIYIWPDDPETQTRFATFLLAQKQFEQALPHLEKALQLRPTARAHYHLAVARTLMGQSAAAVQHYRQALQIEPDWIVAMNDLAWIYATSPNNDVRNGAEALRLAERARDLSGGKEARYWGTLDAAYADNGRFEEAIRAAEQARSLAQSTGQSELVEAAEKRLRLYQQRQPYREPQP